MPYIKKERRTALRFMEVPQNPGELNYSLISKCLDYLEITGESYKTHNDILGVLEAVKQEYYRRVVVPYEDKKMRENGDIL